MPESQETLIRRLAKAGKTRVEIAIACGISTDTLRLRLRELRIKMRQPGTHTLEEILAAFKAAGTAAGAARLLGCTRQAVWLRLKESGALSKTEP